MSGTASGGWHTPRLLIRGWAPPDAPELKAAIDGSLAELQRWMAWARSEPSDLPVIEERLARFQAEFEAGTNWACGIFLRSSGEVLGGVSLLPRIGPGALELGYWLRNECTGRGYATEAAAALTRVGLAMPGIERIEIRCDPENRPSAAVPARLGYRLLRTSGPLLRWCSRAHHGLGARARRVRHGAGGLAAPDSFAVRATPTP